MVDGRVAKSHEVAGVPYPVSCDVSFFEIQNPDRLGSSACCVLLVYLLRRVGGRSRE